MNNERGETMALFGTNGVRGKLHLLTPSLAFGLSASFAAWCGKGKSTGASPASLCRKQIVLARDMRVTSPMLHAACSSGMMSAGADVLDIGLASSPVAEHALSRTGADGLIIVTASHNAPEWNALKFVDGWGVAVSRERGAQIEEMATGKKYPRASYQRAGGVSSMPDAALRHQKEALSFLNAEKIRKRRLRIALDFGNGTSALSRGLFESLGCETMALNDNIDGNFPGRPSEPSEANIAALIATVRKSSADFGVAWDGDSDRVVFVDEKGGFIVGDKGFALSAREACKAAKGQKGKCVVTTVATSRCVEEACAAFGAKTIYTKVGAPYLSEKMAKLGKKAVSGGEEVGGIIWPSFSLAKDGIFAAGKMCEMACDQPLSAIVASLPQYSNSKCRVEVQEDGQKKQGLLAAEKLAKAMGGRLTLIDGVRADFDGSWAIVRASGTENYMRIFAEAKTQKKADELRAQFEKAVKEAIGA